MHCPKVLARTAMPVGTCATWVTPFIFRIFLRLRSRTGRPRCVGGRQTIVGLAPLTSRSVAKSFWPVTAARASVRLRPVPMTRYSSRGRSVTPTCLTTWLAASVASSPYGMALPAASTTVPEIVLSRSASVPSRVAAASSSCWRATAAATRIGVKVETVVLEPPVSWLKTSSGRAGARVTSTLRMGRSSSSARIIAVEVTMPCPTSMRGSSKAAVPSSRIVTVISWLVGSAASVCRSSRS